MRRPSRGSASSSRYATATAPTAVRRTPRSVSVAVRDRPTVRPIARSRSASPTEEAGDEDEGGARDRRGLGAHRRRRVAPRRLAAGAHVGEGDRRRLQHRNWVVARVAQKVAPLRARFSAHHRGGSVPGAGAAGGPAAPTSPARW